MTAPDTDSIFQALHSVNDPEIGKPITELGMVGNIEVSPDGHAAVTITLTVAGCPLKKKIHDDVHQAVSGVDGVTGVTVSFGVMSDEQRAELKTKLRGGTPEREIPFAQASSRTRVFAVASGKGGVGKSSVTANLAVALAQQGLSVGVLDADIYGFSIPRMLGITTQPTQVDDFIMPPVAHGVKVISVGMFVPGNQPVVWRGPMLHRALTQFMADVYWGDLDVLLLDPPPGTGDVAISVAQLIPNAEILVVTTPQQAAAEVAERAGSISAQTHQRVAGVVENMSWFVAPDGSKHTLFGEGGGQQVAESLSTLLGTDIPLLGQIPLEPGLRECSDQGTPLVTEGQASPASEAFVGIARTLEVRRSSLVGQPLGLTPAGR